MSSWTHNPLLLWKPVSSPKGASRSHLKLHFTQRGLVRFHDRGEKDLTSNMFMAFKVWQVSVTLCHFLALQANFMLPSLLGGQD